MIGGKNLSFCKSRPLTNKKANIKTHKYGLAILLYDVCYLTFDVMFRRMAYVSVRRR